MPRMKGMPSPRAYPNHKPFVDAVGGVLPGYAGHRPGALNTNGESAFVGVPQTMEESLPPGQGTLSTLADRGTTSWQEIGEQYKTSSADANDQFRGRVGGVKVGYGGHVPGAMNHYGAMHQGGVPVHDYTPATSQRATPRTPTTSELRKHTFINAPQLAQSDGTRRQYVGVHGASNSAPFGVDETNHYQTESSRVGPRTQNGASPGDAHARSRTPPHEPRRFESTAVYDRDVHHGSAERDMERFEALRQAHVPTPPPVSQSGQPLAPFTFGHGQLDPPSRFSHPPGPDVYQPAHTYEQAWASGVAPTRSPPPPPPPPQQLRLPQEKPQPRPGSRPSMYDARMSSGGGDGGYHSNLASPHTPTGTRGGSRRFADNSPPASGRELAALRDERSPYGARTPPESFRSSWDKTAPSAKTESFRAQVGGVIPGYKGFIPQTPQNVGRSDWGTHDVGHGPAHHMRGHGYGGHGDLGAGIARQAAW